MNEKILLVEDDVALAALVSRYLSGHGLLPKSEHVDVAAVADEVAASETWGREGIEISLTGEASVTTDREMVVRVLSNLLSNAVRHASTRVEVEIAGSATAVKIQVSDDGPGFPPGILSAGFIPFMKGGNSQGVGLGMSIAKRAASIIGGEILAENTAQGGARVTLVIPV